MSRFLLATFVISVLGSNLSAQSPAPTAAPQTGQKSSAQATPSPSASPTVEELVDSLGPADLQAFITLLKANFTARLVGRVLSNDASKVAAGMPKLGAEFLPGKGSFLLVEGGRILPNFRREWPSLPFPKRNSSRSRAIHCGCAASVFAQKLR